MTKTSVECLMHRLVVEGRKEGNVLFNDALNTLYFRLYGVRHIVRRATCPVPSLFKVLT